LNPESHGSFLSIPCVTESVVASTVARFERHAIAEHIRLNIAQNLQLLRAQLSRFVLILRSANR
jgi:hypothetical protein